jgi:2-oxoacid:acceptor oxidoreductase gamma subunit (pyruvate/2-ketoisovalerate family)
MVEIRIHGRGGQGGVTLAKIIATSRFLEGHSVQAFGLYAAERSGAPIQAFCRYASETITNRNLIYEPDHVIVLDPTLVGEAIAEGLEPGGWILINTTEPPEAFAPDFPNYRLATVDATAIARDSGLGTRSVPIVNTAVAGAVGRMLDFGLESMLAALEHLAFRGGNVSAAERAFAEVRFGGQPSLDETAQRPAAASAARPPAPRILDGGGGALPTIETGSWATEQPRRQEWTPPCNHVCPAGNDVRGFLQSMARERIDEALEILLATSPLPSVCGRICPAPCMESCNRSGLDGAVNVRELERHAGDQGSAEVARVEPRDECVAVVGSGPAGLTAAYHLGRLGYRVSLYEAATELGGTLRGGIPEFRLPDEVLDRELERILDLGVETFTGFQIDRAGVFGLAQCHDAVLVATGLQELRGLELGTAGAGSVVQGVDFLDRVHRNEVRVDGEQVVVVGGGDTALDAARSAMRLGADSVHVVYRRSRMEMPAIPEEVDRAIEEGVLLEFLTQPVSLAANPSGSSDFKHLLTCRRMELGEPDESGRRPPVEIEGSDFEWTCDRVILALGQSPDLSVFPEGTEVREGEQLIGLLETPLFAIGDLATREGTVAGAIGSGRRAALHIHESLSGELIGDEPGSGVGIDRLESERRVDVWRDEVIHANAMRLHLFEKQPAEHGAELMPWERSWNFHEVHQGLPDLEQAKRCLSCGVCNECDRCVTYCPEGVLKRVGHDFVFDYSFCKGCGVCAAECPRNVIFMSQL